MGEDNSGITRQEAEIIRLRWVLGKIAKRNATHERAIAAFHKCKFEAREALKIKLQKYSDEQYLDAEMYEDGDAEIRQYEKEIVTTRRKHTCASGQHSIEKGSRAIRESAIAEGARGSAYTCLDCIDQWLTSIGEVPK